MLVAIGVVASWPFEGRLETAHLVCAQEFNRVGGLRRVGFAIDRERSKQDDIELASWVACQGLSSHERELRLG